jgi:para-aminobenzoate synthetase
MKTLLIDNYDSFTFNLFQMIAAVNGEEPIVVRNDLAWESLAGQPYDNIVLSPGPGTPVRDEDFGICKQALLAAEVPILGVCLGHQGIGHLYGGKVRHAPEPMHGRLSAVFHDGSELWQGVPQGFQAVRYHSLMVDNALPEDLERTAWTADEIMMGLRHRQLPLWGVQFHPESICTEHGERLLTNFRDLSRRRGKRRTVAGKAPPVSVVPRAHEPLALAGFRLHHQRLELDAQPERIYQRLFHGERASFWLDSSRAEPGLSRFSFMGSSAGPHSVVVSYDANRREITESRGGSVRRLEESIYAYLDRELERRRIDSPELPFSFNCGFVGYFAYELDASFLLADRMIAIDQQERSIYLLCLSGPGEDASGARAWFDEMERSLRDRTDEPARAPTVDNRPIEFRLSRPHRRYLEDIARCQQLIRDGETYEVCLTNRIHTTASADALQTYLTLRRVNPAPYSAFLRIGDVSVMSSSPERFLKVDRDGWVESKPIKGTRPRGRTPDEDLALQRDLASSEKDRSENLMIVDLVRNDLGIVCEVGSVHVPKLMQVESYQTVHQLVSTIRGKLRPGLSAIDCVRHAFPGGSVTGAPKLRTMSIIDQLEREPRGVYSGAIGYLGLNGTADLNIVIRTLVKTPGASTIGVGGAIVMLSDPEDEFEETLVKARALIEAVVVAARGSIDARAHEAAMRQLRETGVATF